MVEASRATIDIVIPTTASRERREMLLRAIDSVTSQCEVRARPIVVANGPWVDPETLAYLQRRRDLLCLELGEGSAPAAQLAGRKVVEAPYFGFLDDDDEYLQGALHGRWLALEEDAEAALAVDNGYRATPSGDTPIFSSMRRFGLEEPATSLLKENWMASCSALYRTSEVSVDLFEDPADFMEWTYLGLRLALSKKILFLDKFGYRIHPTPGSVSRSDRYALGAVAMLEKMLRHKLPAPVRVLARRKYDDVLHQVSQLMMERGNQRAAWSFHLRSIGSLYGLRYLPYTRHLLRSWFVSKPSSAADDH